MNDAHRAGANHQKKKNLRKPSTDLTDRTMQAMAGGNGTRPRVEGTAESQRAAPSQPMAEPEAAMGGLTVAGEPDTCEV